MGKTKKIGCPQNLPDDAPTHSPSLGGILRHPIFRPRPSYLRFLGIRLVNFDRFFRFLSRVPAPGSPPPQPGTPQHPGSPPPTLYRHPGRPACASADFGLEFGPKSTKSAFRPNFAHREKLKKFTFSTKTFFSRLQPAKPRPDRRAESR